MRMQHEPFPSRARAPRVASAVAAHLLHHLHRRRHHAAAGRHPSASRRSLHDAHRASCRSLQAVARAKLLWHLLEPLRGSRRRGDVQPLRSGRTATRSAWGVVRHRRSSTCLYALSALGPPVLAVLPPPLLTLLVASPTAFSTRVAHEAGLCCRLILEIRNPTPSYARNHGRERSTESERSHDSGARRGNFFYN